MATIHPEVTTSTHPATLVEDDLVTTSTGRRWLAVTRLATGFVFLWAFLDKTFGLHYSTGAAVAEGDRACRGSTAAPRARASCSSPRWSVQGRVRLDGEPGHRLALHALPARCRRRRHAGHRPAGLGDRRLAADGLDVDRRVAAAAGLDQPGDGLPPDLRTRPGRLRDAPRGDTWGLGRGGRGSPSCSGSPRCADVAGLSHTRAAPRTSGAALCRRRHRCDTARVSPTGCRSVTICRMVDIDDGGPGVPSRWRVTTSSTGERPRAGALPIVHVHGFGSPARTSCRPPAAASRASNLVPDLPVRQERGCATPSASPRSRIALLHILDGSAWRR